MKKILTAAAVAVISLILQATCPAFAQNGRNISDNQLVDAVSLYNEGHLQEAEALLSSICAASPENDAAWYYRGLTRIKLQNAAGAESDLKKAVSLDKGNFWYRYMLAGLYGMTGRTELTIDMYKELMKDFPKKTDLYYSLAQIYIGQNDLTEALKTIENIETQFGSNDGTVMTRFNILRRQDKGEEAFRVLDEYSKEYSSPQVLTVLGDYAMGMYDDSTALARYDAALDIDRDYAPAILGKAETYRMTRKYNDYFATLDVLTANSQVPAAAKADYLQAVFRQADRQFINTFKPQFDTTVSIAERVHPNDTSILETAGLYYFSTGRREKAADAFRTMKELSPENPVAAAEYIRILLFNGEWENAVTESEEAFRKFDNEPGFLDFANTAEYQLRNYDKIIDNCSRMLLASPGDSAVFVSSWSTIGDMKHKLGDDKSAFKAYDTLLKRYPDYSPALNNYAWFLAESGKKLNKALAMSKKTIDAEPDNVTYLDTYGWILYLLGRPADAKPYFKHAMMYGGKESATILRHYATVLEALGENDLAAVYRKQAEAKGEEEE